MYNLFQVYFITDIYFLKWSKLLAWLFSNSVPAEWISDSDVGAKRCHRSIDSQSIASGYGFI